jgi:hypothetical protein
MGRVTTPGSYLPRPDVLIEMGNLQPGRASPRAGTSPFKLSSIYSFVEKFFNQGALRPSGQIFGLGWIDLKDFVIFRIVAAITTALKPFAGILVVFQLFLLIFFTFLKVKRLFKRSNLVVGPLSCLKGFLIGNRVGTTWAFLSYFILYVLSTHGVALLITLLLLELLLFLWFCRRY